MMNIPIRELAGYEADDVIGTLTKQATAEGVDTMIVSGDLDGLQLVDDHVRLLTTRMGVAATVIYDEARVTERYGLRPDQICDPNKGAQGRYLGQHPRCRGGEKTASSPLQQFGTRRHLRASRRGEAQAPRRLTEHRESAFMSRGSHRDRPARRLGLEEALPGRYDWRAVAQRFRRARVPVADRPAAGVEHRPTATTRRSRIRLGGLSSASTCLAARRRRRRRRVGPAPTRSRIRPGRARDPRIVRSAEEMEELSAWLEAHGVRSAWAGRGTGRRAACSGSCSRADGSSWYVPGDPSSIAIERLPGGSPDRSATHGHDPAAGGDAGVDRAPSPGPVLRHARRGLHGQPCARSQTIDDMAATRWATLPIGP
jgi:DNA polymerase-1